MNSRILAIETSCDETSAAIIENGTHILSNIIASQTDIHAKFGGIFPEIASRKHIEVVYTVVQQAMKDAHLSYNDLDAIAVTQGPGLVGSLLVGVNVAKGIALAQNKPCLAINHIEGHIYSLWLTEAAIGISFPLLTLVVSGGHTELYLMTDHNQYENLGGTLDDAAGEAFDKVGRLLNLPYPGGPHIDRVSRDGNPDAFQFPRAILDDGYNFSFSGLKTSLLRTIQKYNSNQFPVADLAASFQAAVVDVLVKKTKLAAETYRAKAVHLTGGVSANQALRQAMQQQLDIPVRYPPLILCTDNAAMIGAAAHWHLLAQKSTSLGVDVIPSLSIV